MRFNKEVVLKRIDDLLSIQYNRDESLSEEVYAGALSLIKIVYGDNSPQLNALSISEAHSLPWHRKGQIGIGVLRSLKSEIQSDLIPSLERQARGEIFGDFLLMAKQAIEADQKDVAVVLVSAAFEDALKRLGSTVGLDVDEKDMSEMINALKMKGVFKGPQEKIARSYVTLRNKAFHAQWNKIDTPEVKSLIAFTEEFVLVNFT
jgi:hypothetical protein